MTSKPSLLIVDDDPLIGESLSFVLSEDFDVRVRETRSDAMALLKSGGFQPQLALIDLGLPPLPHLPTEGFKLLGDLLAWSHRIRVLVLSGQNEDSNARRARALGAVELVPKPCDPNHLRKLLFASLKADDDDPVTAPGDVAHSLIGDSPAMRNVRSQIDLYASSTFPALIEGESGSGKEMVAAALHYLSPRAALPFLALNCSAISANLVEPTLFGYVKGAFTGAVTNKAGYFEDARDGTLFLDEIGELPLDLQPKLLRVLENGEFQRVGDTQSRHSQARIIAATNRDLRAEVKAGRFRADLYHRLSVFSILVPPLRELGNDKMKLMEHFRMLYASKHQTETFTLDNSARDAWQQYTFPGNVRELKNIVIRLTAKYAGYPVGRNELEAEFELPETPPIVDANSAAAFDPKREIEANAAFNLDQVLAVVELKYIDAAISLSRGNMSQAARVLGISRSTLYSRLEALRPGNHNATP
ncbi:MAG: sigma-54 dependent transcriptional regulator [Betaproteobacteria bacterium]